MSFAVDDMADGDIIWLRGSALVKNNPGSVSNFTATLYWGSVSGAINTVNTFYDNGTEAKWMMGVYMQRIGSDLWVVNKQGSGSVSDPFLITSTVGHTPLQLQNAVVLSSCTFDSSQTVAVKITHGVAHASTYFNVQDARAHRFSE